MPGCYQAVYNGTKAFIDSYSFAVRHELKDAGVTVTCLMPGATETQFFERGDMMDTNVGTSKKDEDQSVAPSPRSCLTSCSIRRELLSICSTSFSGRVACSNTATLGSLCGSTPIFRAI